jgi:iron complex transport system substrate-binding protein
VNVLVSILLSMAAAGTGSDATGTVRVATLVPWVHDVAALAPGHVEVVASSRSLRHGVWSGRDRVDLGSPHGPSIEALAGARADVVVYDEAMHARLQPKLDALVPKAVATRATTVDATFEALATVGRALGIEERVDHRIERIRETLDGLHLGGTVSAVTLYASPGAPVVITERTWLGDLLAELGVENAAAAVSGREGYPGYVTPSEETLATLRADWILLVAHGSGDEALQALRRRMDDETVWRGLRESVGDRVLVLDQELFGSNPGVRLDEAALWLHARLTEERP